MSTNHLPLVSIISVNFNQLEVTFAFLESLRKISYPNYEIILVDNDSREDPTEDIKNRFPEVILIVSKENLGFAGGNNLGIQTAKGKYFMMLNNDTEVDPNFLEPLVQKMESDSKIGMLGSKVKFYYQPDIIQYAGATPMTKYTATSYFIGYGKKDIGQFDNACLTPFASGAAMMASREVCENVGLMANFFFLYYEELDWQERIRKAGYKIYFVPESVVFHKESVSVGKASALQAYWQTRNRLLLIRRNFPPINVFISIIYMTFISTSYRFVKYLFQGRFRSIKVHFIAIAWHYYNLFNKKRIHQNNFLKK